MTDFKTTETPKKLGMNPFVQFENEGHAKKAARAGVVVALYLVLSYVIHILLVQSTGVDFIGGADPRVAIRGDIVLISMLLILAPLIFFRQSLWANLLVSVLFFLELALKIDAVTSGHQRTNVGYVFMFLALSCGAILSVRGSWTLRRSRKLARSASVKIPDRFLK